MRRAMIAAGCAVLVGIGVEGALMLCARAGTIGSCGPDSWQAFVGLVGNIPGILIGELVGIKAEPGIFALNGTVIAACAFVPAWTLSSNSKRQPTGP